MNAGDDLALPADATAPGIARRHTRAMALKWNLADLADDAELVCSELVTNAVKASQGTDGAVVRLWLATAPDLLVIAVWDASDELPARPQDWPDGDGGRGLLVIDALSSHCGASRTFPGKICFATLREKGQHDDARK